MSSIEPVQVPLCLAIKILIIFQFKLQTCSPDWDTRTEKRVSLSGISRELHSFYHSRFICRNVSRYLCWSTERSLLIVHTSHPVVWVSLSNQIVFNLNLNQQAPAVLKIDALAEYQFDTFLERKTRLKVGDYFDHQRFKKYLFSILNYNLQLYKNNSTVRL